MLEPPASEWMLITAPHGLWKGALAQGITRLLTSLLSALHLGCWQHCGALSQKQEPSRVVLLPLQMMTL